MEEKKTMSLEEALNERSHNFLYISWKTNDLEECKIKILEIDKLIAKYSAQNDRIEKSITEIDQKISQADKELVDLKKKLF
ncbi:hypothetical protein M153_12400002057 [Pseudoloma neurophilia]|uniref:Uncharacterized protein n=1 Tax=Pseudoloma neurophilia TaxID=146866 RepID=A0A0R0LV06_9MICR|nr:hypothetical protein M153_12400002057 [Pseudoloma neurophilia]